MNRRSVTRLLMLLLAPVLLVTCMPFGLRDLLAAATRSALSIEPSDLSMPAGSTFKFIADGGVPAYTYSVFAGGGSIDPSTGEYTAPLAAGTAVIRVTDAAGATADTGVTITELVTGLSLSPSAITVAVNSSLTFEGVGGSGPYTYSLQSTGSGSPDVNATTGYYVAGSVPGTDVVRVTDALVATATATVTVVALTSAVDYSVTSTAALPSSGVAGEAIPGGSSFTVTNAGPGDGAAAVTWKVYLSANASLDGGDVVVDEGTTAALADDASAIVDLSGTYPTAPLGAGFLIVTVDAADDTSPANNTATPKAFTLDPRPVDYRVISPLPDPSGSYAGESMSGTFRIENQGTVAGASTIYWFVYASTDATVDGGDFLLQSGSRSSLGAGAWVDMPIASTWPAVPDNYYLLARVSATDDIVPGNETGSTAAAIPVTGAPPEDIDYEVDPPTYSGTVAGAAVTGTFDVSNTGSVAGTKTVVWTVYRSADSVLDVGGDPVLAVGSRAALAAGGTASVGYTGTWPDGAATWWLFAVVSATDDADPGNNESTSTEVPVTAPNVDYLIPAFSEISGSIAGDPINGTLQVRNAGTSSGSHPVFWTVYLSEDATLVPAGDLVVDAGTFAALGAGANSALIPFGGTWPVSPYPPWTWRLYLVVEAADEVDPSDNTSSPLPRTTAAPTADYDVTAVSNTGGSSAGGALAGTFNATNLGPHDGTQAVPWRVYVSTDAAYDAGTDTLVDSGVYPSPGLNVGAFTGLVSFSGTWPAAAGPWYLIVVLDASDDPNAVNDSAPSGQVVTTAPDVDYDVTAVSCPDGTAGGALAGSFTVQNVGSDDGSRTVYWIAYRSEDLTLTPGTDPVVDSGAFAALAAGDTAGPIAFTGTWPYALTVKTYYLFVRVLVADDIAGGNDTQASGVVTVDPPNIDYDVITINNTGPLVAGAALAGTFQVQNIGTVNGSATLHWSVYRSTDLLYTPVVDPVIASGSIAGGLTAGNSANPTFAGTWPENGTPVTYYYFVRLYAADDIGSGNDEQFSAGFPVNPPAAFPDYRIINPTYQPTGVPGTALGAGHTFQIRNMNPDPGTKPVTWRVYASYDTTLDEYDTLLDQNSIGALGGSTTSGVITYGGSWPAFGAWYNLIVLLDADDDANPANDGWVSADVEAIELAYTEGMEDNSGIGPKIGAISPVSVTGIVLQENRYVLIDGFMDAKNAFDTYRLQLSAESGKEATRINIRIEWTTGDDACDFYIWDENYAQGIEATYTVDLEETTFISLTAGAVYYIGVTFCANHSGAPYKLYLYAEPD